MNKAEIESALNVTTISTDPDISEPLLYASWTVNDGLLCLVGISEWCADENNINYLVTLGNVHYSEKDDKEIYDAFIAKYSRLKRIWKSSHSKERYSKKHFIEWARRDKKICEITWLDDAVKKGLISPDSTAKQPPKDLGNRERNSLHRMVRALADTLLKESSVDGGKQNFENQSALIAYLDETYDGYEGLSKPSLENVLAAGRKLIP